MKRATAGNSLRHRPARPHAAAPRAVASGTRARWKRLLASRAIAPWAALCLTLPALFAPEALAVEGRGPLVAIPYCTIVAEDCGLDPETPDLNPAGCAATLQRQMERRGVRTEVIGPGAVVCGEGSNAIILEATLTATCSERTRNELLLDRVLAVRLEMDLVLKDCHSGEVFGRGRARRAIESGRQTLVRDAVQELSHHTAEMQIRRVFPDTPVRWMRGDIGGEVSFEVSGSVIDIGGSGINEFLRSVEIDEEDYAPGILMEMTYNPWSSQLTRVGIGMEYIRVESTEEGMIDLDDLLLDPAGHPSFDPNVPHTVETILQVLGVRGSVAQGLDLTKNQRLSVQGAFGYYVLGPRILPAEINIEGLPAEIEDFRNAKLMLTAAARYDWRFTPHLAFSVEGGYTRLDFGRPNRLNRERRFPYEIEFNGATLRIGIATRW